jgi:hypothetical protein
MPTKREAVSFAGVLRGQGYEVSCTVSAIRVTLPGVDQAYAQHSISSVSQTLPDGDYQLLANGQVIAMRKHGGGWSQAPGA